MSERTKHTPGPWAWQVGDECVTAESGKTFVAWLPSSKKARASRAVKADARLIAAAPELLAAMKDTLALAERNRKRGFGGHRTEECWESYRRCEAAVKKAEGHD